MIDPIMVGWIFCAYWGIGILLTWLMLKAMDFAAEEYDELPTKTREGFDYLIAFFISPLRSMYGAEDGRKIMIIIYSLWWFPMLLSAIFKDKIN